MICFFDQTGITQFTDMAYLRFLISRCYNDLCLTGMAIKQFPNYFGTIIIF